MGAQFEQAQSERGGLWQKLHNWWDSGEAETADSVGNRSLSAPDARARPVAWPPERVAVLKGLFGDGMIAPWSDEMQDHLIRNLKVSTDSRVVVLGGGLGGAAHRLQQATGAMVLGFDDRIEMADLSRDWLSETGAEVKHDRRDYFDTGLKPGFADAIVAFGGLSHIRDRRRLFSHALQILRPNGRISYMDFFITGRDPECPEVTIWSALEERPRHLTHPDELSRLLYDIGFDTPEFRDLTDQYRKAIKAGFARSVDVLKQSGTDAASIQSVLLAELERWNRRLALLDSGEARFCEVTIEYFGKSAVV